MKPNSTAASRKIDDDYLKSLVEPTRVNADVYSSVEIFELEMDRIFGSAWIYLAHESQVKSAGDFITTSIGKTPLIVVRDSDGQRINVLVNRCGHRGAQVCQQAWGSARAGMFRCPYHGWTYAVDGTLRSQPSAAGYADVGFDATHPSYAMPAIPKIGIYRGFVFGSLNQDAPDLDAFLGETRDTIDNMIDRAPGGDIEVTGHTCHRFRHRSNWKFFVENLHDAMHPMVAHAATSAVVKRYLKEHPDTKAGRAEAEVIAPFGGSYDFFDEMGFVGLPNGHGYMGGSRSIFSHYQQFPEYLESLEKRHGHEKTVEVLSYNKHNTLVYPSCTIRDGIQSIRVVRPVSVNETILESWTFRLKGAPQEMLDRTLRYSRLINSPASLVGPDDMSCYDRIQESADAGAIDWVDLHRHFGRETQDGDRIKSIGTSDLSIRNQYTAWLNYMTGNSGAQ